MSDEKKKPPVTASKPVEVVEPPVVHPADLPEFGAALPQTATADELFADEANDPPPNVSTKQLPPQIFYIQSDKEWEKALPYLIGLESTKRIKELAAGRNVRPVSLLRQGILTAADVGAFDPVGWTEKRQPKIDDDMNSQVNQVMLSVLSAPCFEKVVMISKERGCSNKHGLYYSVKRSLEMGQI